MKYVVSRRIHISEINRPCLGSVEAFVLLWINIHSHTPCPCPSYCASIFFLVCTYGVPSSLSWLFVLPERFPSHQAHTHAHTRKRTHTHTHSLTHFLSISLPLFVEWGIAVCCGHGLCTTWRLSSFFSGLCLCLDWERCVNPVLHVPPDPPPACSLGVWKGILETVSAALLGLLHLQQRARETTFKPSISSTRPALAVWT